MSTNDGIEPAGAIHPAPFEFDPDQIARDPILQFFHYAHLPLPLQEISRPFCVLASKMVNRLDRSAERTAGLRKLLEAKDCMVRAASVTLGAFGDIDA